MADSTIIDQQTFDPQAVRTYYESIIKNFPDWSIQGVSVTNNEDVRRLFVKLKKLTINQNNKIKIIDYDKLRNSEGKIKDKSNVGKIKIVYFD